MKNYEEKIVTETKHLLKSIICNKCGTSVNTEGNEDDYLANQFQSLHCSFGYGSDYDMEDWSFDLCENCLVELVKTFKYAPEGFAEDGHYVKYPQVVFDKWKETNKIDIKVGMTEDELANRG